MAKKATQINAVRKLSDVVDPKQFESEFSRPDQYINKPLIIIGFEIYEGDMGEYMHIECIDLYTEEPVLISTGSKYVKAALKEIHASGQFPITATFKKSGNAYNLADCALPRNIDLQAVLENYLYGNGGASQQPLDFPTGE